MLFLFHYIASKNYNITLILSYISALPMKQFSFPIFKIWIATPFYVNIFYVNILCNVNINIKDFKFKSTISVLKMEYLL